MSKRRQVPPDVQRLVPIRITYDVRVPGELVAIIGGYLPAIAPFIPTEFHELAIHWDAEDGDSTATMETKRNYRHCTLTICPKWLTADEALRRHVLVHEVVHTITAPLSLLCARLIDVAAPDEKEPTGPWCLALEDADESVTQDIARHLLQLIPESAWPARTSTQDVARHLLRFIPESARPGS